MAINSVSSFCQVCKKNCARWSLVCQDDYDRGSTRIHILFCPRCDAFTPEDLDETDQRTIHLPRPTDKAIGPQWSSGSAVKLTFHGAEDYRIGMGPDRPFRQPGSKTMKRRYNEIGTA